MSESDARLNEISRNESILGLERITELLRLMGEPQNSIPIVHVAGTNGKGSFTAMLAAILKEAGLRVGMFTSPAITGSCDSFRVGGATVSEDELDGILASIEPFASRMMDKPTQFEVMTAAAFELFRREECDMAIVECGLGGDGDSTNVIEKPLLSVITNVELDHTDRLGSTIAEIAGHKAGIIKRECPVLFGGESEEAFEVIAHRSELLNAPLHRTDLRRLKVEKMSLDGTDIEFEGFGSLRVGLLGAYQPKNAANVLSAVELLREKGIRISDEAVAEGLRNARWQARFEVLSENPRIIFDGSHNPDGVALAARSIDALLNGRAILLMGVMADKDYECYPALLKNRAVKVFCVKPDNPRALQADTLAQVFSKNGIDAEAFECFDDGVSAACDFAKQNDMPLLAMGTLYMYEQFTRAIEKCF